MNGTSSTSGSGETVRIRVLHIGNIANNAYLNAKILNERGFDCVVASPDYTHIMGCPEWEDADFDETPSDQNDPDWSRIDLKGFRRPSWFIGEPRLQCMARLLGQDPHSMRYRVAKQLERVRSRLRYLFRAVARRCGLGLMDGASTSALVTRIRSRVAGGVSTLVTPATEGGGPLVNRSVPPPLPEGVREEDIAVWKSVLPVWRRIFARYDIVIGYGIDGLLPLLAGKRPYLAFEHGTIRSFPFEDTPTGRLCAATYRDADGVIVTNCDNRVAAERLGPRRFGFIPHPVNERLPETSGVERLRLDITRELGADYLVFHPSRQHWEPEVRSPNWEKGNDILIRGFAQALDRNHGRRPGLVMVRWGRTLEATDRLVEELGIADRVKWIEPLPHLRMCEMILACDAVADQFHLGAFGSLTPKGLMLGRPVLLKLDEAMHEWAFPELPPILNTASPEEVSDAITALASDAGYESSIAEASRQWYARHHSNEFIGGRLAEEIMVALAAKEDDGP